MFFPEEVQPDTMMEHGVWNFNRAIVTYGCLGYAIYDNASKDSYIHTFIYMLINSCKQVIKHMYSIIYIYCHSLCIVQF